MTVKTIENRLNLVLNNLNLINSLVKVGALASDSCIIDKELQLTSNEDYYLLLKEISVKIQESINLLSD